MALSVLSALVVHSSRAQGIEGFQTRTRLGLRYAPTKDLVLTPKVFFYTSDLRFRRTMIGMEANYKLTKWLRAGGEYRFSTSYTRDFHRLRGFLLLDYSLAKRWELEWRPMFQRDLDYFDGDAMSLYPPRDVLRNLVAVNYAPRKRTNYFVAAELYHRFEAGTLTPFRIRPSVGAQRVYKKRHVFGAEAFYIRDFARPGDFPASRLRLDLSYTYRAGKLKGGKKKNEGAEDESGTELMR